MWNGVVVGYVEGCFVGMGFELGYEGFEVCCVYIWVDYDGEFEVCE